MNDDNRMKPIDLFTFGENDEDTLINSIVSDLKNAVVYASVALTDISDEVVKERIQKAVSAVTSPLSVLIGIEEYNRTLYKKEKS